MVWSLYCIAQNQKCRWKIIYFCNVSVKHMLCKRCVMGEEKIFKISVADTSWWKMSQQHQIILKRKFSFSRQTLLIWCSLVISLLSISTIHRVKSTELPKMGIIQRGLWEDSTGHISNPGKLFFLYLFAASFQDNDKQRDLDELSHARIAMIQIGMSLNTNRFWKKFQSMYCPHTLIDFWKGSWVRSKIRKIYLRKLFRVFQLIW